MTALERSMFSAMALKIRSNMLVIGEEIEIRLI